MPVYSDFNAFLEASNLKVMKDVLGKYNLETTSFISESERQEANATTRSIIQSFNDLEKVITSADSQDKLNQYLDSLKLQFKQLLDIFLRNEGNMDLSEKLQVNQLNDQYNQFTSLLDESITITSVNTSPSQSLSNYMNDQQKHPAAEEIKVIPEEEIAEDFYLPVQQKSPGNKLTVEAAKGELEKEGAQDLDTIFNTIVNNEHPNDLLDWMTNDPNQRGKIDFLFKQAIADETFAEKFLESPLFLRISTDNKIQLIIEHSDDTDFENFFRNTFSQTLKKGADLELLRKLILYHESFTLLEKTDYFKEDAGRNQLFALATTSFNDFLLIYDSPMGKARLQERSLLGYIAEHFTKNSKIDFNYLAENPTLFFPVNKITYRFSLPNDSEGPISSGMLKELAILFAKEGNTSAIEYLHKIDPVASPREQRHLLEEAKMVIAVLEEKKENIAENLATLAEIKIQAMAKGDDETNNYINRQMSRNLELKAEFTKATVKDFNAIMQRSSQSASTLGHQNNPTSTPSSRNIKTDTFGISQLAREINLPYLHPKIDVNLLQANGHLLSAEKSREAIEKFKSGEVPTSGHYQNRISTHEYGYTIIKLNDRYSNEEHYYAIYSHKDSLGKGTFGKVVLMQDLESGGWLALKIQKIYPDTEEWMAAKIQDITQEYESAYQAKHAQGQLIFRHINEAEKKSPVKNPEREALQALLAIELGAGYTLAEYIDNPAERISLRNATSNQLLQMPAAILNGYEMSVRKHGLLHRDLKPANFLIDPTTGEIKAIDFGQARNDDSGQHTDFHTTLWYLAPEIRTALIKKKEAMANEKTEIYSLGKIIGESLGLIKRNPYIQEVDKKFAPSKDYYDYMMHAVDPLILYDRNDPALANSNCPKELRPILIDYLARMTAPNPAERPTLAQAQAFFKAVQRLHLQAVEKICTLAMFDVNEYLQASPIEQQALKKALRNADQVILLNTGQPLEEKKYYQIIKELRDEHILVRNNPITIQDANASRSDFIIAAQQLVENQVKDQVDSYVFVTTKTNNLENLAHRHIGVIHSDSPNTDYVTQIQHYKQEQILTDAQYHLTLDALREDRARINEHFKNDFVNNPKLQRYIQTIVSQINTTLMNLEHTRVLTHYSVVKQLDNLQQQLLSSQTLTEISTQLEKSVEVIERLKETIKIKPVDINPSLASTVGLQNDKNSAPVTDEPKTIAARALERNVIITAVDGANDTRTRGTR